MTMDQYLTLRKATTEAAQEAEAAEQHVADAEAAVEAAKTEVAKSKRLRTSAKRKWEQLVQQENAEASDLGIDIVKQSDE